MSSANSTRSTFPWENKTNNSKSSNTDVTAASDTKVQSDLTSPVTLFDFIRQSCTKHLNSCSDLVTIDNAAIENYVNSFDFSKLERSPGRQFPLNFPTARSEVNFLTLLNLLNFASGFRVELHATGDKGAYETICFGLMGLHISGDLTAETMVKFRISEISSLFAIKTMEEYEVRPAIYSERKTALYPLADNITSVLNQAGAMLRNLQCDDFYDFIFNTPKITVIEENPNKTTPRPKAADLITRFIKFFPAFNDLYQINGQTIYIYKKVQLLMFDLYRRFHADIPQLNFSDIDELTVMADNVIPAVLRALNILKLSDSLATSIDNNVDLIDNRAEAALRAGAIVAAEAVVAAFQKRESEKAATDSSYKPNRLNAAEFDYHLWTIGKHEQFRKVPRHATKNTIFY
jgi:hypothetical protein